MKTVLITGGSEGIGFELAKCYAGDGWTIILAARNQKKLDAAQKILTAQFHVVAETISIDLSEQGSAQKLYDSVKEMGYGPDEVINNAGAGYAGTSWEIPVEADERLVSLNDTAVMSLSKLFIKDMIVRKNGLIVNVASTGAFQPGPYIASYYASKAFVVRYSQAMNYEASGTGVRVLAYCPGPVDTGFYQKSNGVRPPFYMSAEKAAAFLYQHRDTKKDILIPGLIGNLSNLLPARARMHLIVMIKGQMKRK